MNSTAFLLLIIASVSTAELTCLLCVKTKQVYFVTKEDEMFCGDVTSIRKQEIKFSAKSQLECDFLEVVLGMIKGKSSATTKTETTTVPMRMVEQSNSPVEAITIAQPILKATTELIVSDDYKTDVTVMMGETETSTAAITALRSTTPLPVKTELSEMTGETETTTTGAKLAVRGITEPLATLTTDSELTTEQMEIATEISWPTMPTVLFDTSSWDTTRRERRFKSRALPTSTLSIPELEDSLDAFDTYIRRLHKNIDRLRLIFYRRTLKFLPRQNSKRTLVRFAST